MTLTPYREKMLRHIADLQPKPFIPHIEFEQLRAEAIDAVHYADRAVADRLFAQLIEWSL